MDVYKKEFIEFLLENGALKFGEFTLKSGRPSPYFVNTGMFRDGEGISRLGYFYAQAIKEFAGEDFDVVFGPAYKGIPLAVATSISLAEKFGMIVGFSFDRKEVKDYGDKGSVVGKIKDGDKIVIVDDVFTTGETKEEVILRVKNIADVKFKCLIIAVDRQEVDAEGKNAIAEFERKYNIPVKSIVGIKEIVKYLHNREIKGNVYLSDETKRKIDAYLKKYGV